MSQIVLDSSVAASWFFEDEANPRTTALLVRVRDFGAIVPILWRWEVTNVLAMAERRGRLTQAESGLAISLLGSLPITTDKEGAEMAFGETLQLARAHKLTVYDAAYLELSLRSGHTLATLDVALREAAQRAGVGLSI